MSESTERNTTPAWSNHGEGSSSTAAARQPQPLTLPPYPPMRFPGDGYDFRRPVMASHSPQTEEIIDLTNEPDSPPRAQPSRYHSSSHRPRHHRPPRFGRNIMTDVVDLEEESDPSHNEAPEATRESPEVQFVRATVRSPGPMPRTFRANFLDYLRFRPQTMSTGTSTQHAETFRQGVAMRAREFSRRPTWRGLPGIDAFWIAEDQGELDLPLDLDMQMNYQLAGLMVENPPPGPSYKPPTPPPEGFTRTVQEDEEVICPNCERELGTGDDERQQIWISKQCGHVCFFL